jgi:hypothetical protein
LKNIYFNFGMFYFRYRPDIFDEWIRFLLNNSSLTWRAILQLVEMMSVFLLRKKLITTTAITLLIICTI